jgi:hypothetical protein
MSKALAFLSLFKIYCSYSGSTFAEKMEKMEKMDKNYIVRLKP